MNGKKAKRLRRAAEKVTNGVVQTTYEQKVVKRIPNFEFDDAGNIKIGEDKQPIIKMEERTMNVIPPGCTRAVYQALKYT